MGDTLAGAAAGAAGAADLPGTLEAFSGDCNHLLALCRGRAEVAVLKKALSKILQEVMALISLVSSELAVEEVRVSAVELKKALFKAFILILFSFSF